MLSNRPPTTKTKTTKSSDELRKKREDAVRLHKFKGAYGDVDQWFVIVRCQHSIGLDNGGDRPMRIDFTSEARAQEEMSMLMDKVRSNPDFLLWENLLIVQIVPGERPPFRCRRGRMDKDGRLVDLTTVYVHSYRGVILQINHADDPTSQKCATDCAAETLALAKKLEERSDKLWREKRHKHEMF